LEIDFHQGAVQGCRSGQKYECRLVEKIKEMDAGHH